MELIVIFIIIASFISNAKKESAAKDKKEKNVWNQVDNGASDFLKTFLGSGTREQITRGVRDFEDTLNNLKRKSVQQAKRKEEASYQQEQEQWRKKQEADRKKRELEERRKKQLELQKKEAEQRRKALEREKREREEKALLEHCQVAQDKGCDVHMDYQKEASDQRTSFSSERKDNPIDNQIMGNRSDLTQDTGYRVEEYLDPLTSSFYPKVDDYLFPTIADFYPRADISNIASLDKAQP